MGVTHCASAFGALLVFAASVYSTGCFFDPASDCERNFILRCAIHSAVSSGAAGGGDGGTTSTCIPSENADPIIDECGVFVSASGSDSGEGTKASPVGSLQKAIDLAQAKGKPVYACAEDLKGAVEVPAGTEIYGGLLCKNGWGYAGSELKTIVTAEPDDVPVKLLGGELKTRIEDVSVSASDAVADGGSSIALIANGATAELVRCELTARNGARGAAGAAGDPNGMSAASGGASNAGKDACSDLDGTPGPDAKLLGGDQVTNDCGRSGISVGGNGGSGNILNGGGGDVGQPGSAGAAGAGEPAAGMWSCIQGQGQIGSDGEAGMPGLGAIGPGLLSTSGYAGTNGTAGTPCTVGQGGGGGGGAKGGMICAGGMSGSGASGGSGGAGGCGGLPGQGGGPGGASIALISLQASITLTDCTVVTSKGGDGGAGGDLQPGGLGGDPGKGGIGVGGSKPGCAGGIGGLGGNGGTGGGGLGGHSLGIAYQGNPPVKQGKTVVTPGTPGTGGPGGSANVSMNAGEAGTSGEEQEFPE